MWLFKRVEVCSHSSKNDHKNGFLSSKFKKVPYKCNSWQQTSDAHSLIQNRWRDLLIDRFTIFLFIDICIGYLLNVTKSISFLIILSLSQLMLSFHCNACLVIPLLTVPNGHHMYSLPSLSAHRPNDDNFLCSECMHWLRLLACRCVHVQCNSLYINKQYYFHHLNS